MSSTLATHVKDQLELFIRTRTGRRIRNLTIVLEPQRVILRGQVSSYYVKQLAQQGVRDFLPDRSLENSIVVEKGLETALG
jgi:hypothetical protein